MWNCQSKNHLNYFRTSNTHNICIAFTVDDVGGEFERLKEFGIEIVDPPTQDLGAQKI
ncbi:VOC family protein [Lacrimispora sphenoides]|uniref:VOC family protein n=1 Tax=Lacrimispora sphenoides TaxID=29370 RepID=UPI003A7F2C34